MKAATARAAAKPGSEKGRPARRPSSKTVSNGNNGHSGNRLRLQRLANNFALFGPLAETVAFLAWGAPNHG